MKIRHLDNREKPIIAIDGPAASGKSTTARKVAEKLGLLYIDTGAMYRAMTLKVLRRFGSDFTDNNVAEILNDTDIKLLPNDSETTVRLDGEDVSHLIRTPEVSANVSRVSAIPMVRKRLVALQRQMSGNGGVVMDGRDIGTIVFPDADMKIYLDASLEQRARRRQIELESQGVETSLQEQIETLTARDRYDSTRDYSPLVRADDAVVIDTSEMSIAEQVRTIVDLFQQNKLQPAAATL